MQNAAQQQQQQQQQQRMPNGIYRGRGDGGRGRGRGDVYQGRGFRGGRMCRGPHNMQFAAPFDAAQNSHNPAAQRGNEFARDAARPQRMSSDGAGRHQGLHTGRGNMRGGSYRGRGARGPGAAQKADIAKPSAGASTTGTFHQYCA